MVENASKGAVNKVSRHNLVQNSRDKFYANLVQVHKENKDAPVLEAAPTTKKPLPAKPSSGTFSRAGAQVVGRKPGSSVNRTQRQTP